ncbi:MAG TPA: hypothetical protein VHX61_18295 [Rhizomicrobium sp.]|nr:hypothetical protein [Rhizomicrobium sp.]
MTMPQDENANTPEQDERASRQDAERMTGLAHDNLCGELEAYIVARPLRALGMALLAGIVVGRLIL